MAVKGMKPDEATVQRIVDREMAKRRPPNPSGILPTEFKCVVRPKEVDTKTAGGIIIPDEAREKEQYRAQEGELIAVSPLAFTYEKWPDGAGPPKPGDTVIFAKFAGTKLTGKDGKDYRLINDRDITATLT